MSSPGEHQDTTPNASFSTRTGGLSGESARPQRGGDEQSIPERIHDYDVVRVIGKGGMGAVYEAWQQNPRRRVALKVIREGQVSENTRRRFENEAHILGLLQHPNVAQVFEAGMFDVDGTSRPFFAMEYIEGSDLRRYLDAEAPGLRARIEIVATIADAVHHAHEKGIIHRDLKPSNVLVTSNGIPKVLDFGIARFMDQDIQATTVETRPQEIVGTWAYMAPEQASGDPMQIDTRTDVYALGVVIYEILSGRLPHDLSGKSVFESVDIIRDSEPAQLGSLDSSFRGDLETIVAKAMIKEKDRRYASADALAKDLRRFLNNEPIEARPLTTFYQLRKFGKRNKGFVAGVVATFVSLVVGIIAVSNYYLKAERAAARAELEATRAAEELTSNRRFSRFLEDVITSFQGKEITVDALVDKLVERTDLQSQAQRLIGPVPYSQRQDLTFKRIAGTYLTAMRHYDEASSLLKSVESELRGFGEDANYELAKVLRAEATIDVEQRGDLASAVTKLEEAARLDPERSAQNEAEIALSFVESDFEAGDFEECERRLFALSQSQLAVEANSNVVEGILNDRAYLSLGFGDAPSAEAIYCRLLKSDLSTYGPRQANTATSMNNLGMSHFYQGRFEVAKEFIANAESIRRDVFDKSSLPVANSILMNGHLRMAALDWDGAVKEYEQALSIQLTVAENKAPSVAFTRACLASAHRMAGRVDDSRGELERSRIIYDSMGAHSNRLVPFMVSFVPAIAMEYNGRLEDASNLYQEAADGFRAITQSDNANVGTAQLGLARVLMKAGKLDEAERTARKAVANQESLFGRDHPTTASALVVLGDILYEAAKTDEAFAALDDALRIRRAKLPQPNAVTVWLDYEIDCKKNAKKGEELSRASLEGFRSQLVELVSPSDPRLSSIAEAIRNAG